MEEIEFVENESMEEISLASQFDKVLPGWREGVDVCSLELSRAFTVTLLFKGRSTAS
jgi:hypothetical protein